MFIDKHKREGTESCLSEFLTRYSSKMLVKDKTYFKKPENTRCIDPLTTKNINNFQKSTVVASGLSDFHKMKATVCKTSFQKSKPKEILYRNVLKLNLQSFEQVFL